MILKFSESKLKLSSTCGTMQQVYYYTLGTVFKIHFHLNFSLNCLFHTKIGFLGPVPYRPQLPICEDMQDIQNSCFDSMKQTMYTANANIFITT